MKNGNRIYLFSTIFLLLLYVQHDNKQGKKNQLQYYHQNDNKMVLGAIYTYIIYFLLINGILAIAKILIY